MTSDINLVGWNRYVRMGIGSIAQGPKGPCGTDFLGCVTPPAHREVVGSLWRRL